MEVAYNQAALSSSEKEAALEVAGSHPLLNGCKMGP